MYPILVTNKDNQLSLFRLHFLKDVLVFLLTKQELRESANKDILIIRLRNMVKKI